LSSQSEKNKVLKLMRDVETHPEIECQGTKRAEANINVPHCPTVESTAMVGFA
jgi:hypothetical protein